MTESFISLIRNRHQLVETTANLIFSSLDESWKSGIGDFDERLESLQVLLKKNGVDISTSLFREIDAEYCASFTEFDQIWGFLRHASDPMLVKSKAELEEFHKTGCCPWCHKPVTMNPFFEVSYCPSCDKLIYVRSRKHQAEANVVAPRLEFVSPREMSVG